MDKHLSAGQFYEAQQVLQLSSTNAETSHVAAVQHNLLSAQRRERVQRGGASDTGSSDADLHRKCSASRVGCRRARCGCSSLDKQILALSWLCTCSLRSKKCLALQATSKSVRELFSHATERAACVLAETVLKVSAAFPNGSAQLRTRFLKAAIKCVCLSTRGLTACSLAQQILAGQRLGAWRSAIAPGSCARRAVARCPSLLLEQALAKLFCLVCPVCRITNQRRRTTCARSSPRSTRKCSPRSLW